MPIYEVTQDATGVTLELEGDRPPTKEDVERAFAFAGRQKYPNAPVLQAPPSLLEQAKAVAPAFMRVAAPFRAGAPLPQDIATVGRTIQQIAGKEPQPGMLEGASRIEKEGIMALLSASPEKREQAAQIGGRLGQAVSEYTPIPEYVTRPAGQVAGQVAADILSPMNLMTLGVAGAARQAARIPSLATAAGEFAEGVAPSAARAAQIADLRRAAETARVTTQVGEAIPAVLAPEMTRGAAESAGIAMQTIADPNASNEEKLRASFEATLGTLFAAGLGAQAARTLGMRGRKGVTQADVLENLASQKQTVGEAINKVSGLIDQMDRIVPVENLRTQFRELIAGMNPDEPFIYRPEPISEGPRTAPEGGRLPVREIVEPEAPETLRTQDQILAERLRARDERIAAEEQAALEREAARAGTPLRTAEEVQAQRAAERQAFRERSAAIREAIGRREFSVEDLVREEPVAQVATEPVRAPIVVPELTVERAAAREGGLLPVREPEAAPVPEGTPIRTVDEIIAEQLRARDERIAAQQQAELEREAIRSGTPLRTSATVQAQRAAERQAFRERAAAVREAIRRREFTAEELMRGEVAPEAPVAEPVSRPLVTPELSVERAAAREGGMLPPREAEAPVVPEGTRLRSVDDIIAERLRAREERLAAEQAAAARTSTPLETVEQKLTRALALRDKRLAAEAVAETLESGAAQGESVRLTRKKVEEAIGIGRKEAGLPVAEQTIFNEVWNKAVEETQGRFRKKAEGVAERLEGLRTQVEPGLGANPFPQLMGAAWNGALSVAQAVIRAGGSIADGVAAGLRYARENFKDKFDETEFSKQLTGTISRPSPIQVPPKMEARAFAERVAAAPGVPPVIRESVAKSPRASYRQQNVEAAAEAASTMTRDQLEADLANSKSNTRTISGLEIFSRQIQEGNMDAATKTALSLSESGTTWGQLINQFKLLNAASKEGIIALVTKSMDKQGRKITPEQATKLGDAMDRYRINVDSVRRAEIRLKEAVERNDDRAIKVNSGLLDMADALKNESDVALNELISRINPSSAADLFVSMVQGSVMSPISIVRNVVGNIINAPLRDASDATAAAIDSALFGGKNSSYNYRARSIERLNAFAKSLPQAGKILLKGSDAMPYELGTDIGNPLNFTRAWRNLYEAMSGQYEGAPIARNIVEATLGAIPDVFLRLTQATDVPFRAAERARIITEVGRQRGLSKSQIELAKRDPKLLRITDEQAQAGRKGFTEDDLGLIEYEAAKAVFQQDNAATRMVSGINRFIKQEGGPVAYVPYRLISLFQKTPINVAAEALSFTPAGVLRNWKDMSVREREIATSRLIIGGIVTGAYAYLYDKGVITPNLDTPGETNKARELAKAGGVMPPGTLNVSGLRRLVRGENPSFQPGDTVKDLSALGTSGALGMMVGTAKRLQERSPTDDPDFLALGKGAALSGINFVMEQQFLKGTSDFIKLLSQESGSALDRFVKSLSVTAASPVAPAILGAVRRVERENLPAIGGEGFIKDTVNELNQRFAAIGLQIPGTRDPNAMPVRRDLWGEPVEQTPKSENPWIYNFFSAAKSRQIDADPLNATLYSIWRRTADNQVIPSAINPKITYKGTTFERMTPDQYDRYTQLVGFYRRKLAERAYLSGQFQQRGDEVRINLMKRAYDKGLEIGKYRFLKELRESGQSLTPQAGRRGFTAE
jgi:hypothetical protein